jgi:hypothetical protein
VFSEKRFIAQKMLLKGKRGFCLGQYFLLCEFSVWGMFNEIDGDSFMTAS